MKTQFVRRVFTIGVSASFIMFAAAASPALAAEPSVVQQAAGSSIEDKARSFTCENASTEETENLISHYLSGSKTREDTSFNLEEAQKDGASKDLLE